MRTIWKHSVDLGDLETDHVSFDVPLGSKIIAVGNQYGKLTIWFHVPESDQVLVKRHLCIVGTGIPMSGCQGDHIGTVQFSGHLHQPHANELVLHVFSHEGS